jgi:hypothetical protein
MIGCPESVRNRQFIRTVYVGLFHSVQLISRRKRIAADHGRNVVQSFDYTFTYGDLETEALWVFEERVDRRPSRWRC